MCGFGNLLNPFIVEILNGARAFCPKHLGLQLILHSQDHVHKAFKRECNCNVGIKINVFVKVF
jgi:hypothetical protein